MSTSVPGQAPVPYVDGVLSAAQVVQTGATIAAQQEPDGAIPWTTGQHADVWNHVEAAMGLLVAGEVEAAERAYAWVPPLQRADGSFPMRLERGRVSDDCAETNMSAYLAVGLWHHWLVRGDRGFVDCYWPTVRAALDWVIGRQVAFGGIDWCQPWADGAPVEDGSEGPGALLAGSSSIYQSLRAGVTLAELLGDPQPAWEIAGGRLGHALRRHRDRFLDKSSYSMDWYYPVLGGALHGEQGRRRLTTRWDDFVVPGLGVRCVDTNPWVTGAETGELVLALDAVGEHRTGRDLLCDIQHLRAEDGSYLTGWVYGDDRYWPEEPTTWTAGAVLLAVDALGATYGQATGGSGLMRGAALTAPFDELLLECGCGDEPGARTGPEESADRVAGSAPGPA